MKPIRQRRRARSDLKTTTRTECGASFQTYRRHTLTCSTACRQRRSRRIHETT